MFKNGFSINNLQWLICHKTKPKQTNPKIAFALITDEFLYAIKNKETKQYSLHIWVVEINH